MKTAVRPQNPASADRPNLKLDRERKRVYWTYLFLAMAGFLALFVAIEYGIKLLRHDFYFAGACGAYWFASLASSVAYATKICHQRGLSEASVRDEFILRDRERRSILPSDRLEIRTSYISLCRSLAIVLGAIAALFWLLVRFTPSVPGTEIDGYFLAAVFGVIALGFGIGAACRASGQLVCINSAGIRCHFSRGKSNIITWAEVDQCRIRRTNDVFGRYISLEIACFGPGDPAAKNRPEFAVQIPITGEARRAETEAMVDAIRLALNTRYAQVFESNRDENVVVNAPKEADIASALPSFYAASTDAPEEPELVRVRVR